VFEAVFKTWPNFTMQQAKLSNPSLIPMFGKPTATRRYASTHAQATAGTASCYVEIRRATCMDRFLWDWASFEDLDKSRGRGAAVISRGGNDHKVPLEVGLFYPYT
jgi:hypothetical protein